MAQLKVNQKLDGETLKLSFVGSIDEDATLESIALGKAKRIEINLEKVASINSCGIREWIKWVKTAPAGASITLISCPKIIVDQINMVSGFLPDTATVESFYVPYFCDANDNEKMVLFRKGTEFDKTGVKVPASVKDEESGQEMEIDVIESKYFKFISSMKG
jgi:anti-anti-sigma regulatory factor